MIFDRIRAIAYEMAGRPAGSSTRTRASRPDRQKPPRLTESWFCCAEPTTRAVQTAGDERAWGNLTGCRAEDGSDTAPTPRRRERCSGDRRGECMQVPPTSIHAGPLERPFAHIKLNQRSDGVTYSGEGERQVETELDDTRHADTGTLGVKGTGRRDRVSGHRPGRHPAGHHPCAGRMRLLEAGG